MVDFILYGRTTQSVNEYSLFVGSLIPTGLEKTPVSFYGLSNNQTGTYWDTNNLYFVSTESPLWKIYSR